MRWVWMAVVAVAWGLAAHAQAQTADAQLAPSPAVACLTPTTAERGEPDYPFAPWKRGEGGHVLVELRFTGATLAPAVKVIDNSGDSALVDAVKTHVRPLRVPCFQDADVPVVLRIDYVFMPDNRKAVWTTPADMADADRLRQLRCLVAPDGRATPGYPHWARRAELQGNVLALLRFTAPDKPPQVTTYTGSSAMKRLAGDTESWAEGLRMPCLEGSPVEVIYSFRYRLEDTPPIGFRNLSFLQFLGRVKGIDGMRVVFDMASMGCPFDVKLQYRQPFFVNAVGQIGEVDPSRQPLLDWLSGLVLDACAPA